MAEVVTIQRVNGLSELLALLVSQWQKNRVAALLGSGYRLEEIIRYEPTGAVTAKLLHRSGSQRLVFDDGTDATSGDAYGRVTNKEHPIGQTPSSLGVHKSLSSGGEKASLGDPRGAAMSTPLRPDSLGGDC